MFCNVANKIEFEFESKFVCNGDNRIRAAPVLSLCMGKVDNNAQSKTFSNVSNVFNDHKFDLWIYGILTKTQEG